MYYTAAAHKTRRTQHISRRGKKGGRAGSVSLLGLEVFGLLEEHGEGDDGAVNEQAADDGHYHSWHLDDAAMGQHGRES
jgi:hypothetical protein